jgi:predicted flap endonuclease-1-like 5' DNA nuclease
LTQHIETIEGIGPIYGRQLRAAGIKVVENLLEVGSTRVGRRDLAQRVSAAPTTIRKWVRRADFFRVKGVGTQYSSLLESAGVHTVRDLSRRNPGNLYETLRATNREKHLVKRTPPYKMVKDWIQSAKDLKPLKET